MQRRVDAGQGFVVEARRLVVDRHRLRRL
jgi:hypothetical protein